MNNIYFKQILPNLYVSSNINILNEDFIKYNIKNIINVNVTENITNDQTDNYNILNITLKDNDLFIKSNNVIDVDFDLINNFIEKSYINKEDVLINSNNIILSAFISSAFIIKKLDISIIDALFYVYKFINIDLKFIPLNYINTLFKYSELIK